jgi:hypothetical protein
MKYLNPLILEMKQVGVIYHFTGIWNLYEMIKWGDFSLKTMKSYVSFTRNPIMFSPELRLSKSQCRIMIDGDKLSSQYRISPFIDKVAGINRSHGESEERILKYSMWDKRKMNDMVNIKDSILEITILDEPLFRDFKNTKNTANNFEYEPNNYMNPDSDVENIITKHKVILDKIKLELKNKNYPFDINVVNKFFHPKYQDKGIIFKLN